MSVSISKDMRTINCLRSLPYGMKLCHPCAWLRDITIDQYSRWKCHTGDAVDAAQSIGPLIIRLPIIGVRDEK